MTGKDTGIFALSGASKNGVLSSMPPCARCPTLMARWDSSIRTTHSMAWDRCHHSPHHHWTPYPTPALLLGRDHHSLDRPNAHPHRSWAQAGRPYLCHTLRVTAPERASGVVKRPLGRCEIAKNSTCACSAVQPRKTLRLRSRVALQQCRGSGCNFANWPFKYEERGS